MNIETSYSGDTAVGVISGRVDSSNAKDFDGELSGIIDGGATNLVLDCGSLRYISSAGLRALLIAIRKTNQAGGGLALCQVPENILEVLKVSGFVRLTKVFDTVEQAQASFA
ncbi:STAS domain-containing protein [Candidatus Palauibacter sp.]|uniref:STAS domain-containing protein n=1 Tax=Candidatus Palauibacter sp. TaxID=3101350 RepID=UPI003B58FE2B